MAGLPQLSMYGRLSRWSRCRPGQCLAATLVAVLALFYAEENWRGALAWARCQRRLAASGGSLNWSDYLPTAVPDELNVFKAPKMAEWFASTDQSELARGLGTLYEFSKSHNTNALIEVTIVPPGSALANSPANLTLDYRFSTLSPASANSNEMKPDTAVIPLIVMDDVPLANAIKALAKQAGLAYVLDPSLRLVEGAPQPTVSIRWENVTAEQALQALLDNYGLRWTGSSRTGVARISQSATSGPKAYVTPAAREQIAALIARALTQSPELRPTALQGSQGIPLLSGPLTVAHTLSLEVRSASVPSAGEIAGFFPTNALDSVIHAPAALRVEPAGSNAFRVLLGPPAYYTAAEYLAWSDQFTNDFDLMRQALLRPWVRRPGDDDSTKPLHTPNFVMMRHVSQTLAQRAQCWLLLERPEAALNELTLLHDLCRLLQPDSPGQCVGLIPAMIDVAVTGLYVNVIADGLRLHAWREPQLLALEQQLKQIDLPPVLVGALQRERAALCRTFEDLGARKVVQSDLFYFGPPRELDFWQRVKRTSAVLLAAAPRGWLYQNMALASEFEQHCIEVFDSSSRTILTGKERELSQAREHAFAHTSPYNFLAAIAVSDFSRAWYALTQNQARVCQAQVACTLERYHVARGEYPETLNSLVPKYSLVLPNDIITGEPLQYRRIDPSTFALYSHGWNQADKHATKATGSTAQDAIPEGAWLWQ